MKRLILSVMALCLAFGTVSFAQAGGDKKADDTAKTDTAKTDTATKGKKSKMKKAKSKKKDAADDTKKADEGKK
ncbi:MAG TPA: hypothetical protein VFW31_15270 [Candidatus Angelobacter sp.]|nr:hypothetical protein [Candidatus Angelobacter sp.]